MANLQQASLLTGLLVLAACGGGVYDTKGLPAGPGTGPGATCDAGTVLCGTSCLVESVNTCGDACQTCNGSVPAGAQNACVGITATTHGTCGYRCSDGMLRCAGGCCGAIAVAAGPAFTCALLVDGTVRCWGDNAAGQLGTGDTTARSVPAEVSLSGVSAIGAGVGHACAVVGGGAVRCWGANASGQATGISGTTVLVPAATPVSSGAIAVAAGASHTCALLGTGAVRCWGATGRTGGGTPVAAGATAIAAGKDHTCALVGGAVQCWGSNAQGQLGTASAADTSTTPIASGMKHLGAFADQTCAATGSSSGQSIDDAIRCWGDSVGGTYLLSSPQRTPAIPLRKANRSTVQYAVDLVAAGGHFVCVRNRIEAVECFGANDAGQLGGTPTDAGSTALVPLPVVTFPAAVSIAAGDAHACAALADGRLRCWGANAAGQLGDGTKTTPGLGILAVPVGE